MSLRAMLALEKNEIVIKDRWENCIRILDKQGESLRVIPNVEIIDNGLWVKREEGIGEGYEVFDGVDDTYTEYASYKTVYNPLFNSLKFTKEKIKELKTATAQMNRDYAKENTDALLKLGIREDGMRVLWEKDYQIEKYLNKQQKKIDNLHIVEHTVFGNLGSCNYYELSERISKRAWNKIKDFFIYEDASQFHDELWSDNFKGWSIKKDRIEELEKLLEIPEHLTLKAQREQQQEYQSQEEGEKKKNETIRKQLSELFGSTKSLNIPKELMEEWLKNPVRLQGEEVENPFNKKNIYGGGQWFIIQDEYIWSVFNNGHDGDYWGMNFIYTGGAGAYGYKFKKTKNRMELLNKLKELF